MLLSLFFVLSLGAFGQTTTIRGNVTDSLGRPVPNVSVTTKGASGGVPTSADGSFLLSVPAGTRTLSISSVGYADQEISLGIRSKIDVVMSTREGQLEAVAVVAYGTQKRKEITSAFSTVNAEAIKAQQVTSVGQALQGTASGVVVVNSSGQPGDNPIIRIGGIASENAAADPLILVPNDPRLILKIPQKEIDSNDFINQSDQNP